MSSAENKGVRGAAIALLAVALVGVWQCWNLERWGFDGPGPGFFPLLVASGCAVMAVVVFLFPGVVGARPGDALPDDEAAEAAAGIQTGGTFALYSLAMVWLCAGAAFAGFTVTAIGVTVLIMRFAEHRPWRASIFYGVTCAAVGLVLFGWLLRVELPSSPIERAFFAAVR